jgi:hypothetical protein
MPPTWTKFQYTAGDKLWSCVMQISIARPGYLVVLGTPGDSCREKQGVVGGVVAGNYLGAITISHQIGGAGGASASRIAALPDGLAGNTDGAQYLSLNAAETPDATSGYGKTFELRRNTREREAQLYRADGLPGHDRPLAPCPEPISGFRIASSQKIGSVWVIKDRGEIVEVEGPSFQQMKDHCGTPHERPGCARGIAVGSDNRPWILGCQVRPDGNLPVLHYNGAPGGWTEVGGWGIEIAVDPGNNLPLVLTKDGTIYYYTGK